MSSVFSKYEKELAGVKLIDSNAAYVFNPKTKCKDLPNPQYEFVGIVDSKMPNFILKMHKAKCKTGYIEDVASLPKRLKADIVNHFYDAHGNRNKKTKAYLVRTDKHTVKGAGRS